MTVGTFVQLVTLQAQPRESLAEVDGPDLTVSRGRRLVPVFLWTASQRSSRLSFCRSNGSRRRFGYKDDVYGRPKRAKPKTASLLTTRALCCLPLCITAFPHSIFTEKQAPSRPSNSSEYFLSVRLFIN